MLRIELGEDGIHQRLTGVQKPIVQIAPEGIFSQLVFLHEKQLHHLIERNADGIQFGGSHNNALSHFASGFDRDIPAADTKSLSTGLAIAVLALQLDELGKLVNVRFEVTECTFDFSAGYKIRVATVRALIGNFQQLI